MSLYVNDSQEGTYRTVTDYLAGRQMKIVAANAPAYVKAEFGSWFSMSVDNAPGQVEVSLTGRNGGSYVNLNFSFIKLYTTAIVFPAVLAVVLFVLMMVDLSSVSAEQVARAVEFHALLDLLIWAVGSALIIGFIGYNISATRRRFVEDFSRFIQSLTAEKA